MSAPDPTAGARTCDDGRNYFEHDHDAMTGECFPATPDADDASEGLSDHEVASREVHRLNALLDAARRERDDALAAATKARAEGAAKALRDLADDVDSTGYGWTSVANAERFKDRLRDRAARIARGDA